MRNVNETGSTCEIQCLFQWIKLFLVTRLELSNYWLLNGDIPVHTITRLSAGLFRISNDSINIYDDRAIKECGIEIPEFRTNRPVTVVTVSSTFVGFPDCRNCVKHLTFMENHRNGSRDFPNIPVGHIYYFFFVKLYKCHLAFFSLSRCTDSRVTSPRHLYSFSLTNNYFLSSFFLPNSILDACTVNRHGSASALWAPLNVFVGVTKHFYDNTVNSRSTLSIY